MTPEEPLGRLCEAFAAELDASDAGRFRADVLDPFRAGGWAAVRAVAAWFAWRPAPVPAVPGPGELARLRDRLTELLAKMSADRPAVARWLPPALSPDPFGADAARLFTDCRNAFAALARPAPPSRHQDLAAEIDRLLAAAPDDWLPAAPVRCPARATEFQTLTGPNADARRLADLARRLHAGDRPPTHEVLNAAADATGVLTALADRADRALTCLRGWAAGFGVELLPRAWSFASPPSADALRAEGAEVAAVYRPDDPAGAVVRVKAFGFAADGAVVRPAVVSVSAGPAPAGLAELEAVADEALRDRLRGWRAASLAGTAEAAAIETFVEFWDTRPAGPDPAVADQLAAVLHGAFGLAPFYPANFQDRPPGWVRAEGGGRMTTGRVRAVLRPGLTDRAGEMRVPARVVVE